MLIKVNIPKEETLEFESEKFPIIIGRGVDCDITLAIESISRKHLEINKLDGVVYIKDLTLSNWVSYNNEKLSKIDPVQFFDFAPLILPGDVEVIIDNTVKGKENKLIESIENKKNSSSDQTITRTKYQARINTEPKKTKRKYTKKKDIKKFDKSFLVLVFVIIILLLTLYIGGFIPGFSI